MAGFDISGSTAPGFDTSGSTAPGFNLETKRDVIMRGRPTRPEFISPVIQQDDTWTLPENLMIDSEILEQIKADTLSPGLTARGQLEVARAARDAQQANLIARQNLAMRGGLSGGAQERLAGQSARDALMAKQAARMGDRLAKEDMRGRAAMLESAQQETNIKNILESQRMKEQAKLLAYASEMQSWAAQNQADATRQSSCFPAGTMIEMEDGSLKAIQAIDLGERTALGGEVYLKLEATLYGNLYDYEGTLVTGSHAVKEDGEWVRVKDSKKAVVFDNHEYKTIFCLANENHLLKIGETIFADFHEVEEWNDVSAEEALEIKNVC